MLDAFKTLRTDAAAIHFRDGVYLVTGKRIATIGTVVVPEEQAESFIREIVNTDMELAALPMCGTFPADMGEAGEAANFQNGQDEQDQQNHSTCDQTVANGSFHNGCLLNIKISQDNYSKNDKQNQEQYVNIIKKDNR